MTRPQQSKRVVATGCAAIFGLICGCDSAASPRPPAGGAGAGGPVGGGVNWAVLVARVQFSVPEPLRISLVESLVDRFNKSQSDVQVKVEFVPQAQARQILITSISAGNPPDCCQMWDNWLGEFDGMGALEDLTGQIFPGEP